MDVTIVLVVIAAAAFAWSNGMHDAANAVATSLSTGTLTPRIALTMAAVLNGLGAMLGIGVARIFGFELITLPEDQAGTTVGLAILLSALGWNLLTWRRGLPTSSTQALIGAMAGAGTAAGAHVNWQLILLVVLAPTLISVLVGFFGTWGLMSLLCRWWQDAAHERVLRWFRLGQSVSAAAVSVGHGLHDGQKTMGVLMLALGAGATASAPGQNVVPADAAGVPMWIRVLVASALAVGTLAGGWPIIRTLARGLVRVNPVSGFAAEAVTVVLLYLAGGSLATISTTMTVTSGIVGGGAVRGLRAVRWTTVRRIVVAWLLTPAVTFVVAGAPFWLSGG